MKNKSGLRGWQRSKRHAQQAQSMRRHGLRTGLRFWQMMGYGVLSSSVITPLAHAQQIAAPVPATASDAAGNPPAPVVSQTEGGASSAVLPDVIVTAERRSTSELKTPVAVTQIASRRIQEQKIQQIADLAGTTPGLSAPGATYNMQSVFIRGIGTTDPGVPSAVGTYVDDVYIPRTFGTGLFDLPDVESIQVLRGPQGTLYGENTSAGALKITTRTPNDQTEASVDMLGGTDGNFQTHEYVSGPIIPGVLAGSFAYAHRQNSGTLYNAYLHKDVNAIDTDQFRGKLSFTPTKDLQAVLSVDGTRDFSDNPTLVPLNYPGGSPNTTYAAFNPQLRRYQGGGSLNVTDRLNDHYSIKSITALRGFSDHPSPWEMDGTPSNNYGFSQDIHEREFTQELQLQGKYDRFNFTTGVFFYHELFDFTRVSWLNGNYSGIASDTNTSSVGLYGEGTYNLTRKLAVTAGVRYSYEVQHFNSAGYIDSPQGVPLSQTYSANNLRSSWNAWTPKLALTYQWTDDLMTYASWTKGDKNGGYNRSAATYAIAAAPVNPETVTTYELGAKARLFENHLQTSVALFYNVYNGYQASISNPIINGQLILGSVIANAAKAKTEGAEAQATVAPIKGMLLNVSAAYTYSRFDSFENPTGAANANYTGNSLPFAPRFSLGASLDYAVPIAIPGKINLNANVNFLTQTFDDAANTPQLRIPSQLYVNLSAHYAFPDRHWTASVWVDNLFDRRYPVGEKFYLPSAKVYASDFNPPREVMVGLRYTY
ncbi:TonB-dependent receptor [Caballeronia sp. LjRoot34]|uniref:TonB-dependent receptor n=1 Tax=Caballeronia sp. LjRoot34 TaxID=3342325 RepID=UPI003ECC3C99